LVTFQYNKVSQYGHFSTKYSEGSDISVQNRQALRTLQYKIFSQYG
jgi:hypothetical protein